MPAPQLTYVYGVRKPSRSTISSTGIGGAELRQIESGGVAALVSELPQRQLELGKDALTTHARVLEKALEQGTVLPMRFGVVLESPDEVQSRVLDAHQDELREQLDQFEGKVELRVRAIYDEQQLMREIVTEDREIAKLRERVRRTNDDASYFDRIRLGELVALAIDAKRDHDTNAIIPRLEEHANAAVLSEPSHERMAFNASFLVDRDRIGEFDRAVDDIGRQQADRMRLKYIGPLPPHSFAELNTTAQEV
jgi:Gas vesicle synthesis protein GvpL/GvpF